MPNILTTQAETAVQHLTEYIRILHHVEIADCPSEIGLFLEGDSKKLVLPTYTSDALGFLTTLGKKLTELTNQLVSRLEDQMMLVLSHRNEPKPKRPIPWEEPPELKLPEVVTSTGQNTDKKPAAGGSFASTASLSLSSINHVLPCSLYILLEAIGLRVGAGEGVIAINNPKTDRLEVAAGWPLTSHFSDTQCNTGISSSVHSSGIATSVCNPTPETTATVLPPRRVAGLKVDSSLTSTSPDSSMHGGSPLVSPTHRSKQGSPTNNKNGPNKAMLRPLPPTTTAPSPADTAQAINNRRLSMAYIAEHTKDLVGGGTSSGTAGGGGGGGGGKASTIPLSGQKVALREARKLPKHVHSLICFPIFNTATNKPNGIIQLINSVKSHGFDSNDECLLFRMCYVLSCVTTRYSNIINSGVPSSNICAGIRKLFSGLTNSAHTQQQVRSDAFGPKSPSLLTTDLHLGGGLASNMSSFYSTTSKGQVVGGMNTPTTTILSKNNSMNLYNIGDVLPTQLIFRTTNRHMHGYVTSKEYEHGSKVLVDECSLPEVFSYIGTIEKMWRDSIDANCAIRKDTECLQQRLSSSAQQYGVMELSVKNLATSFNKMKNDVCTLKSYVHTQEEENGKRYSTKINDGYSHVATATNKTSFRRSCSSTNRSNNWKQKRRSSVGLEGRTVEGGLDTRGSTRGSMRGEGGAIAISKSNSSVSFQITSTAVARDGDNSTSSGSNTREFTPNSLTMQ